jgi:hypothetical protein
MRVPDEDLNKICDMIVSLLGKDTGYVLVLHNDGDWTSASNVQGHDAFLRDFLSCPSEEQYQVDLKTKQKGN